MIGKKFKIKGGLLSDIVSPEELEKMTIAAKENKEGNKSTETEPKTENSENDDASWKSRVSEPATEATDDGNQGCKKASNQNEYADEIGLVEAEEIVTNLEDKVESGEIEDENSIEVVESMQDALTATEEVIEQKEIIDEAAENNELTPTAVSIFKEQCENYLKEVNGSQLSENGEEVDYIESESAGLESDSQQQLKAKCNAIWNTTNSTVKEVFAGIRKANELVAGLQFFGFGKKQNIKITNKAMNILSGLGDYEFMQKGLTYIGEEDSDIPVHINDIGDVIDHFENAFASSKDVEVIVPLSFSISRDDIDEDEAYMEIKKGKVTNFTRKYDLPDSAIEILKKKKKFTNYFGWEIDQLNSGLETYKDDKKIVNIAKELKRWFEKAQTYLEKNVSLTEEEPTDLSTLDAFKEAVVK